MSYETQLTHALAGRADPAATLIVYTRDEITAYPGAERVDMEAATMKLVRRLESYLTMMLRRPDRGHYAFLHMDPWTALIAPHQAPERIYLAKVASAGHYTTATDPVEAPALPPRSLEVAFADGSGHRFVEVREGILPFVLHYSTASSATYVPPAAVFNGEARHYVRCA